MIPTINPAERRQNSQLRELFEEAYKLVEPFMDPSNSWGGKTLEFLAFRVMREKYPEIRSDEIQVFLSAARRVFNDRLAKS